MTPENEELLWPEGAPGALGESEADRPTLTRWLPPPEIATGAAVLIAPGGGYGGLATDHEGVQIAQWLVERGVAAWMLKYRLGPAYRHPAPLQDAARAMRTLRAGATEFGVDPARIGIWGFSAGGHLAATLCTHWDQGDAASAEVIERASCRPDFAVLCYPVITMDNRWTHGGSKENLIGSDATDEQVKLLSNEMHVDADTPPAFLFQTDSDDAVPAENAVSYYLALRRAHVAAELHIYEQGVHGVGLAQADPVLASWPERLEDWLRLHGILS